MVSGTDSRGLLSAKKAPANGVEKPTPRYSIARANRQELDWLRLDPGWHIDAVLAWPGNSYADSGTDIGGLPG